MRFLSLLFVAILLIFASNPLYAQTRLPPGNFTVNEFIDTLDIMPGDGVCGDNTGKCSLRAAIMEANVLEPGSIINLASDSWYYHQLLLNGVPEDDAISGDLDIRNSMTIAGSPDRNKESIVDFFWSFSRDGGFHILSETPINVTLRNLTLYQGYRDPGIAEDVTIGGNIRAEGAGVNLLIENVIVVNGYAARGGGLGVVGGANVTVDKSTFYYNFGQYSSGAIEVDGTSKVTVKNSTLSDNVAARGGALSTRNGGEATLNNVTIAYNYAFDYSADASGGIHNVDGVLNISNSIVSQNGSGEVNFSDCTGTVNSLGNNLFTNSGNCVRNATDLISSEPAILRFPLYFAPGSTMTLPPKEGSPAVNAGNPATCEAIDQRGVARPEGSTCDIGAYEGVVVNQIANGGFETSVTDNTKLPDGWKHKSLSGDKRICNQEGKPNVAHSGKCAFVFKVSQNEAGFLRQTYKINANRKDGYLIELFFRGSRQFNYVVLQVDFLGNESRSSSSTSILGMEEYYNIGSGGTLGINAKKAIVTVRSAGEGGKIYVDDIFFVMTAEQIKTFSLPIRIPDSLPETAKTKVQQRINATRQVTPVIETRESRLIPLP
jgi:hypothetical protein